MSIDSYADLLDVLRRGMAELDLTFDRLNDIAGLADGHAAKILAPNPTKRLGPVSWSIFGALGLRLVVVEDPAQLERVRSRLVNHHPRSGPHCHWRKPPAPTALKLNPRPRLSHSEAFWRRRTFMRT